MYLNIFYNAYNMVFYVHDDHLENVCHILGVKNLQKDTFSVNFFKKSFPEHVFCVIMV